MARVGPVPGVHRWWRSSLRIRVISSTMGLGILLALVLGSILFDQVAQGLVRQATAGATADAAQQVRVVQNQFDGIDQRDSVSLNTAASDALNYIAPTDLALRGVLLTRAQSNDRSVVINPYASPGIDTGSVPAALQQALDTDPSNQQVMVVPIEIAAEPGQAPQGIPSVMVGARVQIPLAGPHDLVLMYPMFREQATLDLIRQWFLIGGAALLVLIGMLAWLATRLVTQPVGKAVEVSQKLAEGDLDQRLEVTGSGDELDRLAASFNTMAASLQRQIRQLESLSVLQQRFVSDVSHELRTPLTTIRMAGEVLHSSREDFSAPVARSAELLQEELDRFEELLTDLLEISRYDSGAVVLEREPTEMVALVRHVIAGLRPLVLHSGSEVRVHTLTGPVHAEIDSRRVERILRNLIDNALEHGEGQPIEVSVDMGAEGQTVIVDVRDHGIGFSAAQAEQVFERFWRADAARNRTTGGTGLGLAISSEDARLHGGWLQAAGVAGAGALFRLTLPISQGHDVPAPPPLQWGSAPATRRPAVAETAPAPTENVPTGAGR